MSVLHPRNSEVHPPTMTSSFVISRSDWLSFVKYFYLGNVHSYLLEQHLVEFGVTALPHDLP
jgi:hypothetical protein